MPYFRLYHFFLLLMGLSAVLAFGVPPKYGHFQPQVQILFAPVSRPVAALAGWMSNRISPPGSDDRRASQDIRQENQQLRTDVAVLRTQLDELYRRDAELSKLGPVKDLCRLVKVIGGDSGLRESVAIDGSALQGIHDDMYVLYPGGLVGQVQRSGVGGSQVRLITDPAFRIRIRFVRYATVNGKTDFEPLGMPTVLAEGAGDGTLVVRGLSLAQIGYDATGKPATRGDTLRDGTDYAVLYDTDCPRRLQGETIGRVIRISPRTDIRLMAEIRLQPNTNLKRLREVMVMTKEN